MKRGGFLVLTLILVLCTSAAFAIFPGQKYGLNSAVGDGYVDIQLKHGWSQGTHAWYHCFATDNIKWAQSENITLATQLSSASLAAGTSTMFVFTNFNNQGPAFTGTPLNGVYSGIWVVFYVTWNPGVTPWVVTDPLAPAGSAPGLPTAGVQATFSLSVPWGPAILDCSIFAVGPLSNPWKRPSSLAPPFYRIPQGKSVNTNTRMLTIPYWNVYCDDPITNKIMVKKVVIPDAHPASLANLIGANVAPVLLAFPSSDRQLFQVMNFAQDSDPVLPGIQPYKVRIDQYPVLNDCPNYNSWRNTNQDYSPVTQFTLLNRNSLQAVETLYNNDELIEDAVLAGDLTSVLYPTPPLPAPPTNVGYPPAGIATLFVLNSPVIDGNIIQ
jgi:hypothetical protein